MAKTNNEKERFCTRCGAKLVKTTEFYTGNESFDYSTGERRTYNVWKCPNKRWVLDSHTEESNKLTPFYWD